MIGDYYFSFLRVLEILFRMIVLGEKPEKASPQHIRAYTGLLSTLCIWGLLGFHYTGPVFSFFEQINVYLMAAAGLTIMGICWIILYCLPARVSIAVGLCLTLWTVVEIIVRTAMNT